MRCQGDLLKTIELTNPTLYIFPIDEPPYYTVLSIDLKFLSNIWLVNKLKK